MSKQLLVSLVVLGLSLSAGAGIVYDNFDDGVIDPAYTITTSADPIPTYTLTESDGSLTLSHLATTYTGTWTNLSVMRAFDAFEGNFHLEFQQSWVQPATQPQVYLNFFLLNGTNLSSGVVTRVGFQDNSGTAYGSASVYGNALTAQTVGDALTANAAATWIVDRVDGAITIKLNGSQVASYNDTRTVDHLAIYFQGKYMNSSTLGWTWPEGMTVSADMVNLVPEPATLVMLGLGAMVLRGRRKM